MSKQSEAVIRWRQSAKKKLLAGFGAKCGICGYYKSDWALAFHHLDPGAKEFTLAQRGMPRSWNKMVVEVKKCALLCHNCHTEVHHGITLIPDDIRRFDEEATGEPMRMRRRVIRRPKPGDRHAPRPWAEKVPDRPRGKSLRAMVQNSSRVAVAKRFDVSEAAVRKWLVADTKLGLCGSYDSSRVQGTSVTAAQPVPTRLDGVQFVGPLPV